MKGAQQLVVDWNDSPSTAVPNGDCQDRAAGKVANRHAYKATK